MSPTDYPLTRALGVLLYNTGESAFVRAADLERALESAPVVYAHQIEGTKLSGPWTGQSFGDTHTARLLCVQPIVRDNPEEEHWKRRALEAERKLEDARKLLELK